LRATSAAGRRRLTDPSEDTNSMRIDPPSRPPRRSTLACALAAALAVLAACGPPEADPESRAAPAERGPSGDSSTSAPESPASEPPAPAEPPSAPALDARALGEVLGVEAIRDENGAVLGVWERDDVALWVDGVPLPPTMGLACTALLAPLAPLAPGDAVGGARLVASVVALEDELDAALDAALARELDVVGVHRRFVHERPPTLALRLAGSGDPAELARGVRAVWDAVRVVRSRSEEPAASFPGEAPAEGKFDPELVESVVGLPVRSLGNGALRIAAAAPGAPDDPVAALHGTRVDLAGSPGRAVLAGDLAVAGSRLQPVLRALRGAGIHVVALDLVQRELDLYALRAWGKGPVDELARALRAALDAMAPESGG
jgi:hypothetical protein